MSNGIENTIKKFFSGIKGFVVNNFNVVRSKKEELEHKIFGLNQIHIGDNDIELGNQVTKKIAETQQIISENKDNKEFNKPVFKGSRAANELFRATFDENYKKKDIAAAAKMFQPVKINWKKAANPFAWINFGVNYLMLQTGSILESNLHEGGEQAVFDSSKRAKAAKGGLMAVFLPIKLAIKTAEIGVEALFEGFKKVSDKIEHSIEKSRHKKAKVNKHHDEETPLLNKEVEKKVTFTSTKKGKDKSSTVYEQDKAPNSSKNVVKAPVKSDNKEAKKEETKHVTFDLPKEEGTPLEKLSALNREARKELISLRKKRHGRHLDDKAKEQEPIKNNRIFRDVARSSSSGASVA